LSVSGTEAVFEVVDVPSQFLDPFIYWKAGIGKGNDKLTQQVLEPKLVSVSPKVGSSGGTLITLNVQGVGFMTQGLEIVDSSTDLSICQEVKIVKYATVECLTNAAEIPAGTALALKFEGNKLPCANANAAECQYTQTTASGKTPVVTSITYDSDTGLTIKGTGFPTTGHTISFGLAKIVATKATASSATEIKIEYAKGVPLSSAAQTPVIKFTDDKTGAVFYATVQGTLTETEVVTSSQATDCSFAGGCKYTIKGKGLTTKLAS